MYTFLRTHSFIYMPKEGIGLASIIIRKNNTVATTHTKKKQKQGSMQTSKQTKEKNKRLMKENSHEDRKCRIGEIWNIWR